MKVARTSLERLLHLTLGWIWSKLFIFFICSIRFKFSVLFLWWDNEGACEHT